MSFTSRNLQWIGRHLYPTLFPSSFMPFLDLIPQYRGFSMFDRTQGDSRPGTRHSLSAFSPSFSSCKATKSLAVKLFRRADKRLSPSPKQCSMWGKIVIAPNEWL